MNGESLFADTMARAAEPQLGGAAEGHAAAPPAYELLAEVGRGGMGVVYRARDTAFNRDVALKFLREQHPADSPAIRRFLDEARITGQLQHPAIPPVHHIGLLPDGRPFLAMKLIRGRTLEDILNERANPTEDRGRFLAIFAQVCQAIGYAHAHNVIHRDLKPANVMVGNFAEVQVMDWGLAKIVKDEGGRKKDEPEDRLSDSSFIPQPSSLTQAGSILGTLAYMPPEQAGGEIKIDARADVFGLGAILCVILTGKPPYVGRDFEAVYLMAVRGQLTEGLARLDACGAEPELVALCKRCLSAQPDDRPANGGEVAKAVAAFHEEAEERARRAEIERARAEVSAAEHRKRRRVQATLGLTFTALLVLGGAFAWWAQQQEVARESEERERRAAVERDVSHAIEDAVTKFERAKGARRDLALWAEARAAALQAEERAAAADAPREVRDRIGKLVDEIAQTEKNRRLVATLLDIQAGMGDIIDVVGDQDFAGADARYSRAFREYGADLFTMTPEAGAALLRDLGGDVCAEVAAAIDDWGYVRYVLREQQLDDTSRLFRVTRILDPDPVRNKVRNLVAARDGAALTELAEQLDPAVHPVQTVNLVAVYLYWMAFGDLSSPIRFLQKAQPHHPTNFQINHNLAFFLIRTRQSAEMVRYLTAAIAVRPQSASAWRLLATALDGMNRPTDALAAWRRAALLAPKNASIRNSLANLLTRTGDPAGALAARREAIALAREAVALNPAWAKAQAYLAWLLDTSGDHDGALTEYTQAARLNPKDALAHMRAAFLYLKAKKPDTALPFAEKAVKLVPQVAQAWCNLGRARRGVGDLDGACAAFREGLKRDENHKGCKAGLAALRKRRLDEALARGNWAAVRDLLTQSIAWLPEDHDPWMQASAVLAYLGQAKEYDSHRTAMLARFGKDDPVTAERTAKACLLLRADGDDLKRAEALAAKAAGAKGHWIQPYAALVQGLAELRRGRHANAEDRLKEALTATDVGWNVTVPAGLALAVCQHHRGDAKAAQRSLTAAVTVLDRDVPAPANLKEGWHDWLICHILRREAEALIAPKKKRPER